jgi:hypothetical protein|nr:hypothetical protein [Neorhizobium tomejilense]
MSSQSGSLAIGAGLIAVAAAIAFTAHGAFSRFDRAELIAQSLPPLLDRADSVSEKMLMASHELRVAGAQAKEAIPEVGSKLGEAGANVLRSFAKSYQDKP